MKEKSTKNFGTRWGFILASVGSAVGMANVWGFPNKLGSNGGGAFLLIYLLFVFIFSYVGLPAEFAMGRRETIRSVPLTQMLVLFQFRMSVLKI